MSIGNKIKSLRKELGITQKELSDGIISRGMLSLIESDNALPSLQSLYALAERLSVPPSFILEEGMDLSKAEIIRIGVIIEREYAEKNYKNVIELLSLSNLQQDVKFADLYTNCAFEEALDNFFKGDFKDALRYICIAESGVSSSLFLPKDKVLQRLLFIKSIIENISDPDKIFEFTNDVPDFEFELSLLFSLLKLIKGGKIEACKTLMNFCNINEPFKNYLCAQLFIEEYKFIDAILLMKKIISSDDCPAFIKLFSVKSTENCCKICEDFKGAYENSILYQELLNKIIIE